MRIGLLASLGLTLDSFFPEIVSEWTHLGSTVLTGASTPSDVGNFTALPSVTRRPSFRNVVAPREIRQWVTDSGVDILVTNTATASALARVARLRIPVVYFCHGLHWNTGLSIVNRAWQGIEAGLSRRTSAVITINSDDEAWFRKHHVSGAILRLSRGVGVPLEKFPLASQPIGEMTRLLWAGEFSERKRPSDAIDALAYLRAGGVDAHLTMLGNGPLENAVARKVESLGLSAHTSLPGRSSFAEHMSNSHALIHTAKWEGLPRVMLEAYAMGRRSYAYDVKGVRDIPGATLVEASQPARLAAAIAHDVTTGQLREFRVMREGLDSRDAAVAVHIFLKRVELFNRDWGAS